MNAGMGSFALLAAAIAGCGRSPGLEPPRVRYGEDVCAQCNMIVNEERFAVAAIVDAGDGPVPLLFDDVSCLFAYEADEPQAAVSVRYVHDANTNAWLDASAAHFVKGEAIRSPMGGGVLATGDRGAADSLGARFGGDVLGFEGLRSHFGKGD